MHLWDFENGACLVTPPEGEAGRNRSDHRAKARTAALEQPWENRGGDRLLGLGSGHCAGLEASVD